MKNHPQQQLELGTGLPGLFVGEVMPERVSAVNVRRQRFYRNHIIYPLSVWLVIVLLVQVFNLDLYVADQLRELEGGSWLLRDHWLVSGWLHDGAQDLARILGLALLSAFALNQWREPRGARRHALLYLLLAMTSSTLVIAVAKSSLGVPCAWDVTRYGGSVAYLSVWDWNSLPGTRGGCFPAGHAAVGYALTALYFVCLRFAPRWRWHSLAAALVLGLVFGIAQQLRGAHFLSHDLWSLAICWTVSLLWYLRLFGPLSNARDARADTNNRQC